MARKLENLRNIGIIAHIDAGKTTVTERMLYYTGATHRMGEVDKGTTTTDFDPEEQERGITIYSACVTFGWKGVDVNLIDTPGHVDFTAEVERSLRVLDGGVVVFSSREGVEAQSETVWRQADKYGVPRIAFINKMDREGADFHGTFEQIKQRLSIHPVAIQIPVGSGPPHVANPFRGIIDLVGMKFLTFKQEVLGKEVVEQEIPPDLTDEAALYREHLLGELFAHDDEIAALVLEEKPVPQEMDERVIRSATLARKIVPVLCGSALDYIGIQPLLDAVKLYLPSPADVPPIEGLDPRTKGQEPKKIARKADVDEPFAGLIFKIQAEKHGDLYFVRVYSGSLKQNSRVYNPGKDIKENAAQLWHVQASRREQIPLVEAGDIVGIIGPRNSITGDTLCDTKEPILLESIQFPETVISMAIEPETSQERKKLSDTLEMMKRQDPTFRAQESEETGQTLISGMGELHLEVIKHKLLRDFNLDVRVHKPRVSYRETVGKMVDVTGECHRLIASGQVNADVKIRIAPDEKSRAAAKIMTAWFPQDEKLIKAAQVATETLAEHAGGGGLFGFPLFNCTITLLEISSPDPAINEVAIRVAAADAFTKALNQGDVVILEPIMKLEVSVPEENLGDIVGDLQQRRATITGTDHRGKLNVVSAEVPLAKMFGYSMAVRSLSQGRASFSMEPFAYGPAPPEVRESFG